MFHVEHLSKFINMEEKELHRGVVPFLICKDYLVSNETYEVMLNKEHDMLVTSPIPVELEKYYESENYQSHYNSKKSFFNLIYNTAKGISFSKKRKLFHKKGVKQKLLDIGAGNGDFLLYCRKKGCEVVGVEPSSSAREIALEKGVHLKETVKDIKKEKFDVITMWHVLEHIPDLYTFLDNLRNYLKKDGKLLVAVPNFKSHDAQYYKEFWAAYDVPRHLWHFSQNTVHKLFEKFHMTVTNTYPMKFDSFYVSLLSEKYKTGKQNYFKAFRVGWSSNKKARRTSEYSSLIYEIKHK